MIFCNNLFSTMPVFAAMILILMLGFKWVIFIIEFAILIKKFWISKKDFLTRKILPSRWSQKEISTQKERKIECFFPNSNFKIFRIFHQKGKVTSSTTSKHQTSSQSPYTWMAWLVTQILPRSRESLKYR